jgi:hypothetical protein
MIWPFQQLKRMLRPSMTWVEAVRVLNAIQYKPTISLGWAHFERDFFILQVQATVMNTDDHSSTVMITSQHIIRHESEEQILRDVMNALIGLEKHEALEFFRYKGIKIFDPHARVPMDLINGVR